MARNAPREADLRKDVNDEEVTPEALDELAARANELSSDGDDDDDPADEIIELDDEDSDDDDDGEGDDGDGSDDIGDNFDDDDTDDDDDDDDDTDDEDDGDDDDDEDDDTDDEDEDDSDLEEDDDNMAKDMTADAPKEVVDEDEIEETQPENGDGKKKNEKEAKKSSDLASDLRKAIDAMVRHGQKSDPSVKKEALMAKELHGGGLNEAERAELAKMLIGGAETSQLQKAIYEVQTQDESLQKSMVSNESMGLAYDAITKSLLAQAEHLESSCQNLEATQHLMAKTLVKIGESVVKMLDGQDRVHGQLAKFNRSPVSAPRSVGVDWARKSLAGAEVSEDRVQAPSAESSRPSSFRRVAKASPTRLDEALAALTKSVGEKTEMGKAYASARDAVAIHRPMMPSIAAKVEEYLGDH